MPRAVARTIAQALRTKIEAGEWADARLPPERRLAADFGVARNTVRRAIDLLKRDGEVAGEVGRGTFVVQRTGGIVEIAARMGGASPADVMEVRLMLEPGAAAFAATNASASEMALIAASHRRAMAASEMPEFERWDAEFHHRVVECSRNDLLKGLHELLRLLRNQAPWFEMKRRSFSEPRRLAYCEDHAHILDALQLRDPEAARQAMLAHLLSVRANMLGR